MTVVPFKRRCTENKSVEPEEIIKTLYSSVKLSNILHELIMASDKILQEHGYKYINEESRDSVKDGTHKAFLSFLMENAERKRKE